jgi:uncharacterized damage-inducible protein DinB
MDLRYPIGEFKYNGPNTRQQQIELINQIAEAPRNLRNAARDLSAEQLDTPYRPDGWTVRQVIHHLPDSHVNSYVRFKWALTEDEPVIKAYDEVRWSDLEDARNAPPEISLSLLEALHRRWVLVLRSLTAEDFKRTYRRPELGLMTLDKTLSLYAWHGRHHVSHITSLRERMSWQ